jgi:hypothetical protein
VRVLKRQGKLITGAGIQIDSEDSQQVIEFGAVNNA